MYLFENPVLQRELLVNLRMAKAFLLLFFYIAVLGGVVYLSWPRPDASGGQEVLADGRMKIDLSQPQAARRLVDLFFLGQYLLVSMIAPSFTSGALSGEKERKTYEMLLASPLRPAAIILGKLLASLSHLGLLIMASLPIVMLCLPLGGVSLYEVLAAYLALILSAVSFGMISLACSCYFKRSAASMAVSYLLIMPLVLSAIVFWQFFSNNGEVRLWAIITVLPIVSATLVTFLFVASSRRLLHPPDVGSEGKEVVDVDEEQRKAVGMVIQRSQFPDSLFAPAKRLDLLEDGKNPIFDKEMRSEIFSQGTLMLRVVIQISMILAFPLMGSFLFFHAEHCAWYISYVVMFNMLVGPVFLSGSVSTERERQTLELLLTTTLTPSQILWGKLLSGLRISGVLTFFLFLPVLMAAALVSDYWRWNIVVGIAVYFLILCTVCLTTGVIALFCSIVFRRTRESMIAAYLSILTLFGLPMALHYFSQSILRTETLPILHELPLLISPFGAIFNYPLESDQAQANPGWVTASFFVFYGLLNVILVSCMGFLFRWRYRAVR